MGEVYLPILVLGILGLAFGLFAVFAPVVIGQQIKAGTPQLAFYGFSIFYAVCLVLNWWFYLRKGAYVQNP